MPLTTDWVTVLTRFEERITTSTSLGKRACGSTGTREGMSVTNTADPLPSSRTASTSLKADWVAVLTRFEERITTKLPFVRFASGDLAARPIRNHDHMSAWETINCYERTHVHAPKRFSIAFTTGKTINIMKLSISRDNNTLYNTRISAFFATSTLA
jgi:hypothetical protein